MLNPIHPLFIANALLHSPALAYTATPLAPIELLQSNATPHRISISHLALLPSPKSAAFDLHLTTDTPSLNPLIIPNYQAASFTFLLQDNNPLLARLPPTPQNTPLHQTVHLTLPETLQFLAPTLCDFPLATPAWPYPLSLTYTPRWPSSNPSGLTLSITLNSRPPTTPYSTHPLNLPLGVPTVYTLTPAPYWGKPSPFLTTFLPYPSSIEPPLLLQIREHLLCDLLMPLLRARDPHWILASSYVPDTAPPHTPQIAFTPLAPLLPVSHGKNPKYHPEVNTAQQHNNTQLLAQPYHALLYHHPLYPFPFNTTLTPGPALQLQHPHFHLTSLFTNHTAPPETTSHSIVSHLQGLSETLLQAALTC